MLKLKYVMRILVFTKIVNLFDIEDDSNPQQYLVS